MPWNMHRNYSLLTAIYSIYSSKFSSSRSTTSYTFCILFVSSCNNYKRVFLMALAMNDTGFFGCSSSTRLFFGDYLTYLIILLDSIFLSSLTESLMDLKLARGFSSFPLGSSDLFLSLVSNDLFVFYNWAMVLSNLRSYSLAASNFLP